MRLPSDTSWTAFRGIPPCTSHQPDPTMPHRSASDSPSPLRDRFNFQAGILAAYLAEALPEHRVRQATILLDNLVRTGRQTLDTSVEHQTDVHGIAVKHPVR